MAAPHTLYIETAGRIYSGSYTVANGSVWVASAYGSASAPLTESNGSVEALAGRLLREIVQAWNEQKN